MPIRETVESTPLIDNHAHAVEPLSHETVTQSFASFFTEGNLSQENARHTLNYRSVLDLLGEQFDGKDEETLLECRADVDLGEYTQALLSQTNTEYILVDDGFPDVSPSEFATYTDVAIKPIHRIENAAEAMIPNYNSVDSFEDAFVAHLDDVLSEEFVALKTVVAYRTGLDIHEHDRDALRTAYENVRKKWSGRLEHPVLNDYIVHLAAEAAARHDVPLQFHTGFGDADANPRFVDPTYLYEFLRTHADTPIVLLHGGYPYTRAAGYVTATLDNVYLDLSLATPFIQHGVEPLISQALELAPTTKLLYASDAFSVPELYLLAERRFRADLTSVLERLHQDGFMTEEYAEKVARSILRENAVRLYDL
ncbi:amidohydrolase family protein [Haladaptatus caseinilyticus]|uniref:amidohydrolase family protein n=1 Tax=Haladaptatus caseinilyticus TaxID=2993314 RepID=UPI00224AB7A9|nr:amidohydrolase family protein [Haladaptatus caseinilyticus]